MAQQAQKGLSVADVPLWWLLLNSSSFRSAHRFQLVENFMPVDSSSRGDVMRQGLATSLSVPHRMLFWMSKCRWNSGADRMQDVSAAAVSLLQYNPSVDYWLPHQISSETNETTTVSITKMQKIVASSGRKATAVVPGFSVDALMRSPRLRKVLERWWQWTPKICDAVSEDVFIHLHMQISAKLLYDPCLCSARHVLAAREIAQCDWKQLGMHAAESSRSCETEQQKIRSGPGVETLALAMGPTIFMAAILTIIEPWMETFSSDERIECLDALFPAVFSSEGILRKLDVTIDDDPASSANYRGVSPSRINITNHEQPNDGVADAAGNSGGGGEEEVVDVLEMVELGGHVDKSHLYSGELSFLPAGNPEVDVSVWRQRLRERHDDKVARDSTRSAVLHNPHRHDTTTTIASEGYGLERVLLHRAAERISRGESLARNSGCHSLVHYATAGVIPHVSLQRITRQHASVVERFRAVVNARPSTTTANSGSGSSLKRSESSAAAPPPPPVAAAAAAIAPEPLPHYATPVVPSSQAQHRANLYFRLRRPQSATTQMRMKNVPKISVTRPQADWKVPHGALPCSFGALRATKIRRPS